jgi:hypothetical protein
MYRVRIIFQKQWARRDLDKNSFESKDYNLEFIFGSRIYVEKFEKNLDNRDFY